MNEQFIKSQMSCILRLPQEKLKSDSVLTDLVMDSFALIDMVIELQDELDIVLVQEDLKAVATVGDLIGVIKSKLPAAVSNGPSSNAEPLQAAWGS